MWLSLLHAIGLAWWVEVKTKGPDCTYYFGPFSAQDEAEAAKGGYIHDLEQEGALNIQTSVRRMKPDKLTIEGSQIARESDQSATVAGKA